MSLSLTQYAVTTEKLVLSICENWVSSNSAQELSPLCLVYSSVVIKKEESHCFAN